MTRCWVPTIVGWGGLVERVEDILVFHVGQDPRFHREIVGIQSWLGDPMRRKRAIPALIIRDCQADLLEVVDSLHPASCLATSLNAGQEQGDRDGDDRDDDQQFNQCEPRVECTFL